MSDWQADFQRVTAAVKRFGRAVKPVIRKLPGSSRREPFGSAFIIEHGGEYAAVTAAHVVEDGPEPRFLGVAERGSMRWPAEYVRIVAKASDAPDADVAFVLFAIESTAGSGAADAFPLTSVVTGLHPGPNTAFLALGHPVSKGKIRQFSGTMRAGLALLTGEAIPLAEYALRGLDARVHLAMHYVPAEVRGQDGSPSMGPAPFGMSGGVLLLMRRDTRGDVELFPAGVITAYRPGERGMIVATRMDAVVDHLAPQRPPSQREFEKAVPKTDLPPRHP